MPIQLKQCTLLVAAATVALAIQSNAALADSVVFDLNHEFSGAQEPAGPVPWLRATFADIAGGVQLTMDAIGLSGSEFVMGWYFNLDPALSAAALTYTHQSGEVATVSRGTNAFRAAGDGYFDILFEFPRSGDRFRTGETSVYDIKGIGITAASFDFGSFGGSNSSAAHIGAIGVNGSGWIGDRDGGDPVGGISSVPEPASLALLSIGSLTMLGYGWRRKRAA